MEDLSGHGHDLALKNFAFAGMSGFGGYINFPTTGNNAAAVWEYDDKSVTFLEILNPNVTQVYTWGRNLEEIQSSRVVITGVPDGARLEYKYWDGENNVDIYFTEDGEYVLPKAEAYSGSSNKINFGLAIRDYTGKCNVRVEFLPLYPNALVFDGVDDYGVGTRDSFDKCTMFMLFKPIVDINIGTMSADFRQTSNNRGFALYRLQGNIAYDARNDNGTYINNKLNNELLVDSLINKKHLITIKGNIANITEFVIAASSDRSYFYDNMALYKFLLFDQELTQEQIDKVIQDYHLMDDVDDVWNQ